MRPLIGAAASTPLIAGRIRFCAAAIKSCGVLVDLPIASNQRAVPSYPTGAEPTIERPAASNSRIQAV